MSNKVQFCKKSTLSSVFQTYILNELYKEEHLYHLYSYKKELDLNFNNNSNAILPSSLEKAVFYEVDNLGIIKEISHFIKKIRIKHLVKEWIREGSDEMSMYKLQWENENPNLTFDPLKFFDGMIYYNLDGIKTYYFAINDSENIFDILPQGLVLQSSINYDVDPIKFIKFDEINQYFDYNNMNIPQNSIEINNNLPITLNYNKVMLCKEFYEKNNDNNIILNGNYYNANELKLNNEISTNYIKYIDTIPIEINYMTSITRDSFMREIIQSVLVFSEEGM